MKLLITSIFLLMVFPAFSQSQQSILLDTDDKQSESIAEPDVLPKNIARKFRRDAARLVLRMESENEDLRFHNIIIPKGNYETIFGILKQIYLNDETAKSIARCNVHTHPNPSIEHFIVIFNRDIGWASPLADGIHETESDIINGLLDEYDLIIDKHVQWSDEQDAITIRSKEPLNMAALANEFYNEEGVDEVDLGIPKINGNDIQIRRIGDGWELEYILRFGGLGKASKSHSWIYNSKDDGTIEFIKEIGDEIPTWMKCMMEDSNSLQLAKSS